MEIGRISLSDIKGKRIQIAGSANYSVLPQKLKITHSIVYNLIVEILSQGGGLVITLGNEPKKEKFPLIFDWTIIEAVISYLNQKDILQWKEDNSKPIIGVVYNKFKERIPEDRKGLWKKLSKSNHFGLKVLPDVSSFGGNLRKAQSDLGDVLIILGGSKGVYDLAKLYANNNKLVIPINVNLKKDGTKRILEEIYNDPDYFYPHEYSEHIISLLNSYQIDEDLVEESEVITTIINIITTIKDIPFDKRDNQVILAQYDLLTEQKLLKIMIQDMAILQQKNRAIKPEEDKYSLFLSELLNKSLEPYGYLTDMHNLSGKTEKINDRNPALGGLGEIDIRILKKNGELTHICEALVLSSMLKKYIEKHLKKIFDYDANGLPINFLIIYSKAKYFSLLWEKYSEFIEAFNFQYELTEDQFKDLSADLTKYANIKIGLTSHKREGRICKLYHIFLNFN